MLLISSDWHPLASSLLCWLFIGPTQFFLGALLWQLAFGLDGGTDWLLGHHTGDRLTSRCWSMSGGLYWDFCECWGVTGRLHGCGVALTDLGFL